MNKEILEKFKLPIGLSLVGLVLIAVGMFSGSYSKKPVQFPKESVVQGAKTIHIDISGAVQKPGVYQLTDGDRIEDAVSAAGGFTNDANKEYVAKFLNLAQKLLDGSKVYVPFEGDSIPTGAGANNGAVSMQASAQININTASQTELEALSGVGPVTASKIISGRPYQSIEELLSRKIIGGSTFEKIKAQIVVY